MSQGRPERGQARSATPGAGLAVGVIGIGSMGAALVRGLTRADAVGTGGTTAAGVAGPTLIVWDKVEAAMQRVLGGRGVAAVASLNELVGAADVIVVTVKPKDAAELLDAVAGLVRQEQIVVSAVGGLTLEQLREAIGPGPVLFRIMPNLGVEVGAGAVAVASEPGISAAALETVLGLFQPLGLVEVLAEEAFDALTAVSGSSPAFLAVAIESLEDGAVAAGLSRAAARTVVRQAALATARRLLGSPETTVAPEGLPDSPGDPDPAAMRLLEERGVSLAFRRAVQAAAERSRQMKKKGS